MTSNIGHRGAAGLEPENTLRSFRRAATEGADAVELDLRLTRDRRLVVLHDATVDRTTGGSGPVSGMTLDEVRRLVVGPGEKVPAFEEVLEATGLPIYAELKVIEAAAPLAVLIRDAGLAGRVTPISFYPEALSRIRATLQDLPVGLLLSGVPPDPTGAQSLGATLVSLEATHLDAASVRRFRQTGFRVTSWTVNEQEEMRRLLGLGVDGIVTDRPDLLAGLAARGPDQTL